MDDWRAFGYQPKFSCCLKKLEKDHIYKIGQIKAATQWACFYFILQKKTATYNCDKK